MFQIVLAVLISTFILGWYFLYYAPKQRIIKFAKQAEKLGYKVKLMPFAFMKYYLMQYVDRNNKDLQYLKNQFSQYDLIVGNMTTNLAIIPIHTNILKDAFNQLSKLPKNQFVTEIFKILNNGGIPFAEGDSWKRKRKIISSVFHFDFLNQVIPTINQEIDTQFKKIDQEIKKGKNVNLAKCFTKVLSSVIAKSFFGTNMQNYTIQGVSYCDYYVQFLDELSEYFFSKEHIILRMNGYKYGLSPKSRQLKRKFIILEAIAKQVTYKQFQKVKNGQHTNKNLISSLYQAGLLSDIQQHSTNSSEKYTLEQLTGEFFAFFGAGTDTTAATLNIAFNYLGEQPQIVNKLSEEIKQLNTNKDLSEPEKLKLMKWHDAVFNEVLRINGPAYSLFPRISAQAINVGGLQLPKNTTLSLIPLINCYSEKNFKDPRQFLPERWISEQKLQPFSYIPFGAGQRNCIGQYLSKIEAKLLISRIIQKYEFKSVDPLKMSLKFVYSNQSQQYEMKHKSSAK